MRSSGREIIGFFKEPEASLRLKDSKFVPQRSPIIEATRRDQVDNEITYIENALNAKPFIFIIAGPKLYSEFPMT